MEKNVDKNEFLNEIFFGRFRKNADTEQRIISPCFLLRSCGPRHAGRVRQHGG